MSNNLNLKNFGLVDYINGRWSFFIVQAPSKEEAIDVYKYVFGMQPSSQFYVIRENGSSREQRMFRFITKATGGMRHEWSVVKDILDKNRKANEELIKQKQKKDEELREKADMLASKNKIKVGYGD